MIRQALLGLAIAVAPVVAAAHSKSEATTPADGATVTEVPELSMRFDDPMRIISVMLTATDDDIEIERDTGMEPTTEFRAVPLEALHLHFHLLDFLHPIALLVMKMEILTYRYT